ncbi:MAG: DNA-processing protein DprA [Lachnospiraceae bacterium]|nr:DNA-processing protein DprA [Lachnospiraceae bacterium]
MYGNTLKYIWLTLMPGWGCVSINRLLSLCGGIEECFEIDAEDLYQRDGKASFDMGKGCRIGKKRIDSFIACRDGADSYKELLSDARDIMQECEKKGISIITTEDPQYPIRFKGIEDMPSVLYIKGRLDINRYPRSVGIVGARRCSAEGKNSAIDITIDEVKRNAAIISGMAKGIDSYAHTAALKNNGYTIAVLGNGVDICYPKEHMKLYEKLSEQGCILSEYPPGTHPREYLFPKRNRLIAALSDVLYVVDAGRNSGTVTTVESAEKYGRTVIAVVEG